MGYCGRGHVQSSLQQKKRTWADMDETPSRTVPKSKLELEDLVPELDDSDDEKMVFTTSALGDAELLLSWIDHAQSKVGDKKTAIKVEQYAEEFAKVPHDILARYNLANIVDTFKSLPNVPANVQKFLARSKTMTDEALRFYDELSGSTEAAGYSKETTVQSWDTLEAELSQVD